ncbi:MAG: OsmC family protein [Elusimicrobiales bacterium]|jgi:ribosomal protein S12 methylthiotransferase accessory factor|nr:OsmC family protein [Elusimicrobiales bacterium]NLH38779.1 osmotically inducible protein OsmC [Elusimicrobiota bacterium]
MSEIKLTFPSNQKVNVSFKGFEIKTDQPLSAGGDGTAPSPFDYFLASLASCAGFYAINFFRSRKLNTDGFDMKVDFDWDEKNHRLGFVNFIMTLPPDFPDKYIPALKNAVDLCTVKRTILNPPEFKTLINKN